MEEIILNTSDEAAKLVTVTGWVSRDGRFYGDDERLARWAGCTHIVCDCGAPVSKTWTKCDACQEKSQIERYNAMPVAKWNGKDYLCSQSADQYFADLEAIDDWRNDQEESVANADLRLIICEPNYPRELDVSDYNCDELAEDAEVPNALIEAAEKFNEVVRKQPPLSWSPGKFRTTIDG